MSSCLHLLICAAVAAVAPAQEAVGTPEFTAALRWFDTLGYASVADKSFVRVATGQWSKLGNEPEQNAYAYGFLLADDGKRFTVLTLDLETQTFSRTPPGAAEHLRVGFSVESLQELARTTVAASREQKDERRSHLSLGRPSAGPAATVFVMAWACQQRGDAKLALDLAGIAREAFRKHEGGPLRDVLARDLGNTAMWRLILDFGNREVTFAQLLERCERFLQQFPNSEHAERAQATRQILRRMVKDQQARAPLAADANEDARIQELVFLLRDQNGQQWSQPGGCDTFADPRGEQSPAHRLAAFGYRALPFLLQAFDDDSFTRSVGFHRNFYFSHEVLRVRDVAEAVASRITGTAVQSRAEAERLWRDVQRRGERALLIEGAEGGNVEHLERLLQRHPDAVLPALRKALTGAKSPWMRERLLAVLAGVPGDEPMLLLGAELQRGGDVKPQVTAAVALLLRGQRDAAIDAMVSLWQRGLDRGDAESVGTFLAVSGAVRAVEALGARPEQIGDDVLAALGAGDAGLPSVRLPDGNRKEGLFRLGQPEAGVEDAIEGLLGRLLDVTKIWNGTWGGTSNPMTRDFAARAMQQRWPQRYPFDFGAPRLVRDRQILAMQGAWRRRQGLPPLRQAERPVIPVVDRAKLEELLGDARREHAETPRRAILDRIEALGLGALPLVREHAAAAKDSAQQRELVALQSRIASRVREVRLAAGSAPFQTGVSEQAMSLVDKRLDPEALVEVLCAIGSGDGQEARTVSVTVTRSDDGTGVVVEFAFGKEARGVGDSVSYSSAVSAGVRNLDGCFGGGVRSVVGAARHYHKFQEALAAALLASEDQVVDARYEMTFK